MLPCEGSQCSSFGAKSARFWDSWRGGDGSSCRQKIHRQHDTGTGVREIDFKNAFNTLRRDSIIEAVAKFFSELLAQSTIGQASVLQFGDFVLRSVLSAQQGDLLRPLYFCLAFRELLESRQSELVLYT